MAYDRFIIGPTGGLQTDVKPWLIPDEAMATMENAYVFRGRIRKRFGSLWMGNTQQETRLRVLVATTDGAGTASGTVPGGLGAVGQMFSIGSNIFTVQALGTPVNMLIDGTASTAQFNTTTGAFAFTGTTALTAVYWYPALPVMGLITFESININPPVFAFDTRFAYQYQSGWERLAGEATPGAATWTGSDSQFFWGTTWTSANAVDKALFVTNFNENEPNFMRYFLQSTSQWNNFRPAITGTDFLNSARILVVFKNRLVAFNTWEGAASPGLNYKNRARWAQVGSPLDVDAWRQDIPGKGNALDASTVEAIITVEFIKDRLIVFFERSTYEFVYTGNQVMPFTWQKINTELGAESTFSIVPFDKVAIGVGNVGIMSCNGSNVERIDERIPNTVFEIHNGNDGPLRVYGIRDYFVEMVYWTFPSSDRTAEFPFPNRILVYNYKTGAWAFNDDSFTAFGYFYPQLGVTWDSTTVIWDSDVTWDGGPAQSLFRQVIAGNQEGWVVIVSPDTNTNAPALQITNILNVAGEVVLKVVDHNLEDEDFIRLDSLNGLTGPFFPIYQVDRVIDRNTFVIIAPDILARLVAGDIYNGGGTIARVSRIDMLTKQFNFYVAEGRNAYVPKVDFSVDRTTAGALTIDFFVSSGTESLVTQGVITGSIVGTNVLETSPYAIYPFEQQQDRLWHVCYFQADGEFIQLRIYLTDAQMLSENIRISPMEIHAMIFHAMKTSSRLQ